MARSIGRHRFPEGYRSLFLAATEAFAEQGFHATTTRQIAARAGMSPTALYAHFASKEDVLYAIAVSALELSAQVVTEQAQRESTPTGRLRAAARSLSAWNAHHLPIARVVLHQLDALTPEHLVQIGERKRAVDRLVRGIIADGAASGEFDVVDVRESAIAVLSLCLDVARWYRPGGAYGPEEIGERNAAAALRIVGARDVTASLHFSCETQIAETIVDRAKTTRVPLIGRDGLLTGVNRAVLQAALDAELDEHLRDSANTRNGSSPKTVRTELGEVELRIPRDRDGTFEPTSVARSARSLAGFDEVVVSLHAKGLSLGAIQDHLAQVYGITVSRSLLSRLTRMRPVTEEP